MAKSRNIRSDLCKTIASLDPDASKAESAAVLDKVISSYFSTTSDFRSGSCGDGDADGKIDVDDITDGNGNMSRTNEKGAGPSATRPNAADGASNVTPLMVACDKSNKAALLYLREELESETSCEDDASKTSKANIDRIVETWGHPADTSSPSEGGNSALHHAAAVGFSLGVDVLLDYDWLCCQESNVEDDSTRRSCRLKRYLSLISQTNHNGDTPLMMACVFGHVDILCHLVKCAFQLESIENKGVPVWSASNHGLDLHQNNTWEALRTLFAMQNDEGCSALNLACGHGHVMVVESLIHPWHLHFSTTAGSGAISVDVAFGKEISSCNECKEGIDLIPLVDVSYNDVRLGNLSLDKIAADLKLTKKRNIKDVHLKPFVDQHERMRKCMSALELKLELNAEKKAAELMGEQDESTGAVNSSSFEKSKNARRKKTKKQNRKNRMVRPTADHDVPAPISSEPEDPKSPNATIHNGWSDNSNIAPIPSSHFSVSDSPFITLQDGSIISRSQQSISNLDKISLDQQGLMVEESNVVNPKPASLETILKAQYLHEQQQTTSEPSTPAAETQKSNNKGSTKFEETSSIEAKMESLCLDPSMLLLSPHGMAMEMSPCQLDAMESILRHQLNAMEEARKIQERLLLKSKH